MLNLTPRNSMCLAIEPGMTMKQLSSHFGGVRIFPISFKYTSSADIHIGEFYVRVYLNHRKGHYIVDKKVHFINHSEQKHDLGYQIRQLPAAQQHFVDTYRIRKGQKPSFKLKPSERPSPPKATEVLRPPLRKANKTAIPTIVR